MPKNNCGHPRAIAQRATARKAAGTSEATKVRRSNGLCQTRTCATGIRANAALVCLKSIAQRNKTRAAGSRHRPSSLSIQRSNATIANRAATQSGCVEKKMKLVRQLSAKKNKRPDENPCGPFTATNDCSEQ